MELVRALLDAGADPTFQYVDCGMNGLFDAADPQGSYARVGSRFINSCTVFAYAVLAAPPEVVEAMIGSVD